LDNATDKQAWTAPAAASRKKNPVASDEKSIARGRVEYSRECRSCHGAAGRGDGSKARELKPQPADLTAQQCSNQTDGALFWKITEGRKSMPSFEGMLSDDERWDVVNYLRSLAPPQKSQSEKAASNAGAKGSSETKK
jgi:mono/diheme cytochrome c family protein